MQCNSPATCSHSHEYSLSHHQDQDIQNAQGGQCDPREMDKRNSGGTDESKIDRKEKKQNETEGSGCRNVGC